jgi:hypothetical protein
MTDAPRRPGAPLVTVFTSTVYPDVARVWHACVSRAFPAAEARIEIFLDSERDDLDPRLYPGAAVLRRAPARRDYHEAYNDAVARAETPYLAFVDSDVLWTCRDLWEGVKVRLAAPRVAAVSCVSQSHRPSHGTFAVVLKAAVYREVFARSLPLGFFPARVPPPQDQAFQDTGDLAARAVMDAGWEIDFQHRDRQGEIFRLHSITLSRREAELYGSANLLGLAGRHRHYFRGCAGNVLLARLHDRLFDAGPRYELPVGALALARACRNHSPEEAEWRRAYWRQLREGARRLEAFVRGTATAARAADTPAAEAAAGADRSGRAVTAPLPASATACRTASKGQVGAAGTTPRVEILRAGEFYHHERFGPATVNRGAVLLGCEWDGGVFESGVMAGGDFRGGEFRGGTFWKGIFWAGRWRGGTWESGFDRDGRYRPRTDAPRYD